MTKYQVLGPRILIKVRKFDLDTEQKFEGTSILMPEQLLEKETSYQTSGEVLQIGPTVNEEFDGFSIVKVGDKVHFQRYGAMRLQGDKGDDFEYWVVNGKDLLVIEN